MSAFEEPASPRTTWLPWALLAGLAVVLLLAYGARTPYQPALADEFIYLAGAEHFARTGSLDARFYDAHAILLLGHPHHDVHTPGYVLILGALMAAVGSGYWSAVALNVLAYLASAWLMQRLTRHLAGDDRAGFLAAGLYLLLPGYLAYVYWSMAEVVLGAFLLATLACAATRGDRTWGAAAAGVLFGISFLIRESALFGLPAVLGLLWRRGRIRVFLLAAIVFILAVYVPLSQHRATGGANFWSPTSGTAFGFQAVRAAMQGDLLRALDLATSRARGNLAEVVGPEVPVVEKAILLLDLALPLLALSGWKGFDLRRRAYLGGLLLGWAAMVAVLFGVYVAGQWSGFRYLMILMPAFLPFIPRGTGRSALVLPALLSVLCLWIIAGTLEVVNPYKASRSKRQEGIASYVEHYLGPEPLTRVALQNGWLFGLRHYPVEVISSLPQGGGELRSLERAIWFDVLVLPGDSPLGTELDARVRYQRLNPDDPEAPLFIYRRLK